MAPAPVPSGLQRRKGALLMSDPSILFVPGIGMPPQTLGAVRWSLEAPSAVWQRPGYRATEPVADFDAVVCELEAAIAELRPSVVVGISGGATLALAWALRTGTVGSAATVDRLIIHEPFLGGLVPELDQSVREMAERIGDDPPLAEILAFLDTVYGEAHRRRFPPEWIDRNAITIADEIRMIPQFQPTVADLGAIRQPTIATVGERSPDYRHAGNAVLAAAGLETLVMPGAGHVPPIDQPELLVRLVERELSVGARAA